MELGTLRSGFVDGSQHWRADSHRQNFDETHIIFPHTASLFNDNAADSQHEKTWSSKLRNPLGLKLLVSDEKMNESAKYNHRKVDWTTETLESSPCSPMSSISGISGGSVDDSGFSSDESTHLPSMENGCKLCRTKSLRSALRSPTRSASHKTVRFADSLGLDLEQKTYFDSDDYRNSVPFASLSMFSSNSRKSAVPTAHLSATNFPNRTEAEASHLTRTQCVSLRTLEVLGTNVNGTINVLNLSCDKQVSIRYTSDNWASYAETHAVYSRPIGNDGAVDEFSYFLSFPNDLPIGASCHFCVHYCANGTSYWDSNNGHNYMLTSIEAPIEKDARKQPEAELKHQKLKERPRLGEFSFRSKRSADDRREKTLDYLPHPPSTTSRPSRISGWGRSGYSYDDEMGFY